MDIDAKTIPHKEQRYPTIGDYWEEKGVLKIRISDLSDWRYEMLILVHELIEWTLCKTNGILEEDIKEFDEKFEKDRAMGLHNPDDEPGDHRDAPYRKHHQFATEMEMRFADALGLSWEAYEKEAIECHNSKDADRVTDTVKP